MLVWQNVYLSKFIIADPAVQSIRKVVIQYIRVKLKTTPNMIKKDKNKWFRKDDEVEAVMFVQTTKDKSLKKEVQQCADKNRLKIKVIEKVDNNLRKELQRSNPFKGQTCG